MSDIYLKKIKIEKVRHIENIDIPLSNESRKHLILTGKNGSGKTSLLEAIARHINYIALEGDMINLSNSLEDTLIEYKTALEQGASVYKTDELKKRLNTVENQYLEAKAGVMLEFNVPADELKACFEKGEYILAYYEANRKFSATLPKHVEKVQLKDNYGINESPRSEFVKYILDLKMTEAIARTSGKNDRAEKIHKWFENFEKVLKQIFDDDSVKLEFDEDTFTFSLHQKGKETFDFLTLSDGFAAILDIVVDLMIRMEKHLNGGLSFELPGIVMIDEIETHLHLELQKKVLSFLMNIFPKIQFIVSTHSPFILSSVNNTVVFDMENHVLVTEGLANLPYDGIIKGYFEVDDLSEELREKFDRYKELVNRKEISDDDMEEIAGLEMYLDEIPDYLALGVTTEYLRLKREFENREDL